MILKKQVTYPIVLSLLLIGMLFGYQNCSKSKKLQLDIQNSSQYVMQSGLRAADLEALFKGLLDQERDERIAADAALDSRINALNSDLQGFKTQTNNAIVALEDKTKNLEITINNVNSDLSQRIAQAEAATKALEQKTDINLINLDISLREQMAKNGDSLKIEIQRNTQLILEGQAQNDEQKKLIAEQADTLLKLIQSFNEYKNLVAVTYATKEEMKSIKKLYETLNQVVYNLDLKVTFNQEQIAQKLEATVIDLNNKITNLESKLNQQGKDIQNIRNDLSIAITEYKTEIKGQSETLIKLINESQSNLTTIVNLNNVQIRQEISIKIDQSSLAFALYVKKAVSDLAAAITALDKKIVDEKNLSEAERNKLKADITNLRNEMANAIAEEQAARNEIADGLKALTERVQRLELDAKELRQMAENNAAMINKMGAEFNAEKASTAQRFAVLQKDLDDKIAALRNEFSEKLDAVARKSEELVRDLGEDVRIHFVKVTADIALLNNRAKELETGLRQMVETYQTDRSKLINFEENVLIQKNGIQPHLINTINALSAVQFRFIQVLAPDELKKDFYDADMKELMASCGGNKNASFANIMGLDSFQLLSLEYLRLLGTGVRSSNKTTDAIFFSYGSLDSGNTLARSISLALTRHTALAGDSDCLTKATTWATKILLNDARFANLANKLASDEELERRVGVLYASFAGVKAPSAKLQKSIEDVLVGVPKATAIYETISAQLSLDLITDAWGSMLITERLKNFSDIEKLQTGQSELAEEMRSGFKDLRKELDSFKLTTNAKIAALETQQGKITAALKKALDVIITLADRSNYPDLVLYTRSAGEDISYAPQIIPNWTPLITSVQHFFSGPQSLISKQDACTGATILPVAGAEMIYKTGVWSPCWPNFRNFPLQTWESETKTVWLRVFGAANVLNFKVVPAKQTEAQASFNAYNYDRTFDFRSVTSSDPTLKLTGVFSKGVFDVKTPDLFDYYVKNIRTYGGLTVSITAMRKEGSSQVVGNTIDYRMQIYSPLILDFVKASLPRTLSLESSGVEFDHQGTGKPVMTGWISGSEAGFLTLGRPSKYASGKIDGSKLFGEGTKLVNGKNAQDGFEALRQFDKNHDGVINAKDQVYSELSVWFDYNSNGAVEPGEMVSLKDTGVASINLNHSQLSVESALNNGNDIRYKSSARAQDGSVMANVYDVFFATEHVQYK